jgi:hypothetical protein
MPRPSIHGYVSQRARDAIHGYAEANGVSVTGLLETLCSDLGTEMEESGSTDVRVEWIKAARRYDVKQRRR